MESQQGIQFATPEAGSDFGAVRLPFPLVAAAVIIGAVDIDVVQVLQAFHGTVGRGLVAPLKGHCFCCDKLTELTTGHVARLVQW